MIRIIQGPGTPRILRTSEGAAGLSAFEIARNAGFEGTEAEWLESLEAIAFPTNGATLTESNPLFSLGQTWNNAAETFVGGLVNITRTAAGVASAFLVFAANDVDQFRFGLDGDLYAAGGAAFGEAVTVAGQAVWTAGTLDPADFADAGHGHAIGAVAGLQDALDAKLPTASFTWAGLAGTTPTTAAGYGLTDVWTTATLRSDNAAPWNFFVGYNSGSAITSGTENLGIGPRALASLTSGTGNLGIGHSALGSLQDGINNTAIGWDSQFVNVSGTNNVSLGEDALKYVLGDNNTGLGYTAGYSISTGDRNVAIAPNALYNVTTGDYNIGIGYGAGATLIGASTRNVIIGQAAYQGGAGTVCTGNTIIGDTAGYYSTGSRNVFLGASAGTSLTLSDRLVIDDRDRGSEANIIAKALLYGVFDDAVANQSLNVNAALNANGNVSLITDAATLRFGATADLIVARHAAGISAWRNGAAAQVGRWYNTYTNDSNGEWMSIGAGISGLGSNTFGIFLGANGTGNTTRPLYIGTAGAGLVGFVTSGTTRWNITSAGHWNGNTHNAYDFGAPAAAARTGYFGTSVIVGAAGATLTIPDGVGTGQAGQMFATPTSGFAAVVAGVHDGVRYRRAGLFVDDTNGVWGLSATYSSNAPDFVIRMAATEFLRIRSDGGIGIGGAPSGHKVDLQAGTSTTQVSALRSFQTWNNAGVVFTHRLTDVTDTASHANSLLQDWQVSGVSKLSVRKDGAVSSVAGYQAYSATAIPAGGTAGAGFRFSSTANFGVFFGSGAPTLAAGKGSLYLRSDGSGTGDRAYINTDGATTWTALTTAA